MIPCACMAVWYSRWVYAAPVCAMLFVLAALTDFLDGYLARKMVRTDTWMSRT